MSIFDSMQINASGLSLERLKLDTISTNIANANTTRTEDGEGPYLKKEVVFEESLKHFKRQFEKLEGKWELLRENIKKENLNATAQTCLTDIHSQLNDIRNHLSGRLEADRLK